MHTHTHEYTPVIPVLGSLKQELKANSAYIPRQCLKNKIKITGGRGLSSAQANTTLLSLLAVLPTNLPIDLITFSFVQKFSYCSSPVVMVQTAGF